MPSLPFASGLAYKVQSAHITPARGMNPLTCPVKFIGPLAARPKPHPPLQRDRMFTGRADSRNVQNDTPK
jgi:hypothetical protein